MKSLVAIAALAVAALAPLRVAAQGQAPAPPPLTPPLEARLLAAVAANGSDGKIAPRFATALGLSAAGQPWPDRHMLASDAAAGHYFAVGRGAGSELLFTERTPKIVAAFRVSRDGRVLSALTMDVATQTVTMLDPAQMQAAFAAECGFWARSLDGAQPPK